MEARVSRVFLRIALYRQKGNVGGGQGATPCPGVARGGPAPGLGVAALVVFFDSPSDFVNVSEK